MKKKLTIPLQGAASKKTAEMREQWILLIRDSLNHLSRDRVADECRKRKIPIAKFKDVMTRRLAEHLVDAGLPVTVTIG